MRPLRILHVMDKLSVDGSQIAGPARQLAYRLPAYPKDCCRTRVCGLREDEGARGFLEQHGVDTVCLGRGKFDVRVLQDLRRIAAEWQPTLLHLHGYASWTFGRLLGRLAAVPVVIQEHFIDPRMPSIQRLADRALGDQQQGAIAVSEAVKRFMVDERCVRTTPVEVIWNAVPVAAIRAASAAADAAALRASLGIPPEAPVVGIVGRLAREKGHDCFLETAARIRRRRPDAHFVIVGAGPLRARLERLSDSLELGGSVCFAGHQPDVVPYLSMFSVCVMPSLSEGFPLAALETLAAGTPAVLTDLDAYRGVYVDGQDVLIVPVNDPEATAAAALRLLDDPGLAERLAGNAQRVLSACTLEAVTSRYLALYERMLGRASARPRTGERVGDGRG